MTTPLLSYVDVWRLIDSICITLWKSVSYVVHVAWPRSEIRYPCNPTIFQSLIYLYVNIQRIFYGEILCSSYWVLSLYFLCGTRKETHMEIWFPPIPSQIRDTAWVTRKKLDYWSGTWIKSASVKFWVKLYCRLGNAGNCIISTLFLTFYGNGQSLLPF